MEIQAKQTLFNSSISHIDTLTHTNTLVVKLPGMEGQF